jgi:hypothetical protein
VADAGGGDRDPHLTGAGLGQVELGEAQALARGGQDGGADHGAPRDGVAEPTDGVPG